MPLRNQPYLPLYIQDFITDEKLIECSASAHGVYIRLMCLLHKSEQYGTILLKQKYKQSDEQVLNFASQLAKNFPFDLLTIQNGLKELISEGVLKIEGDLLFQKRMVKDNDISEKRALAGKKGGDTTTKKNRAKPNNFAKAKQQAKHENEIEIENEDSFDLKGVEPDEGFTYAWESVEFKAYWIAWRTFREQVGKPFFNLSGEQAGMVDLSRMAKDEEEAKQIIRKALSNGWKDLYPLKKENEKANNNGIKGNDLDEFIAQTAARVRNAASY